jgi:benzoylformate decarboxylase
MTGAEVICHILREEGVEYIFGVPGNTEVPLLDTIARTPGIKFISAVHESVSVGMADGYARVSGRPGVALVHTAPGTANAIGNLYNAYNAGTPLVLMAGQQDSRFQWQEPLLDADLLPMVSQFTKGRWWVGHADDIPKALDRAFKEASTPPTGPVFLAIPRDLQTQAVAFEPGPPRARRVPLSTRADRDSLVAAAKLLAAAEQPAIMAGHRVPDADAVSELVELAELLGAPVYTTALVPKLIFPKNHPLYFSRVPPMGFSLPGLDGPADVLLAVGSGLFKQLFHIPAPLLPATTKLIHLDVDPQTVCWECPTEVALVADPKVTLAELAAETGRLLSSEQREKIQERFDRLKDSREQARAARELDFAQDRDAVPMRPARALAEIALALPEDAVVVDEAVMLTSYIEYLFEFSRPGSFISTNACLGWGLPASLGASLGTTRRPVVALIGDGSVLFGLQALWTASRYCIPVVMVVLNNSGFAAIKWAFSMYSDAGLPTNVDLGCEIRDTDFPGLARALGVEARRIETPDQVGPAVAEAIKAGKPVLIDIALDPTDVGYGIPSLK